MKKQLLYITLFLSILSFASSPIFEDNFNSGSLSSEYRVLKAQGGFTPQIVDGRLRLTDRRHNLSTAITLDWEFPADNNKFVIEFDHFAYNGCDESDRGMGDYGADGMAIILYDSSVGSTPSLGAFGGSLGYAQLKNNNENVNLPGFEKGWIALGLDEYGNFITNDEGREDINGNTVYEDENTEKPNSVAIRGKQGVDRYHGYVKLAGYEDLDPPLADKYSNSPVPSDKYRFTVDSTLENHLYIKLERDAGSGYQTIINNFDALNPSYHQSPKPKFFRLAISASSGGGCNIHEIDNLKIYGIGWEYGTPKISILDVNVTEGDSGLKNMVFTVSLDKPVESGKSVTIDYETIDTGSAASGVDFVYKNSSITLNEGESSKNIVVEIKGDTNKEGNETFKLKLSNAQNAVFDDDEALGTIIDDDNNNSDTAQGICYALPDDSNKLIKFIPNPGASPLPTPTSISLSQNFNGEGSAYRATDGKIYAFKNASDSDNEPSSLYSIDPDSGDIKLVKSNLLPYSVEAAEFYIDPNSGEETLYVIAKEHNSTLYAFNPNDNWSVKSGYPKNVHGDTTSVDSLAINPNTGEAYTTNDYDYDENNPELYRIDLSTANTTYLADTESIVDAEGLAYAADGNLYIENELDSNHRIYEIDPSNGHLTPAVNYDSISGDFEAISCNGGDANLILKAYDDVNVTEGDSGYREFNITLEFNRAVTSTVEVEYHTEDITATAGADYEALNGKVTVNPGENSVTIPIKILGDTVKESNETFSLILGVGGGDFVIPDSNITVTIIDDDEDSFRLSGRVFEDVNGDHQIMTPSSNVLVKLYKDNGDGIINDSDTLVESKHTDSNGSYDFDVSDSGVYFVAVDSKSITPYAGFNSGYNINSVWAEQTYAPKGGLCADGSGGTSQRSSKGSCYGGRRGTLNDDFSTIGKIEHVAKVEVTDSNVSDLDFGFSFNVVTNINDSSNLQGSFRQFIKNANAIKGANHMRFVPSVLKNASKWWSVKLNSSLPLIEDDKTVIDGEAYDLSDGVTVRNDNSGYILAEEKVGVGEDGVEDSGDEAILPDFPKKEFEIDANDKFASVGSDETSKGVIILKSSNNIIKNISIFNAAINNIENGSKSSAILTASGTNNKIEQNFIGPRADGSDPGAGKRVNDAIYHKSGYALITKNYVAYNHYTGIWASSNCDVTYNYLNYPAFEPLGDGITYEDSNGDDISIKYNYIENAKAYGIEGWGADSSVIIEQNTLSSNGRGYNDSNNEEENGGIRIYGNDNRIRFNLIKNHPGAGIVIASGKRNLISKNSIYSNGGLSLDIDQTHTSGNINGDGVNPNDGQTFSNRPNKGLDYPIITYVSKSGNNLRVKGYVGKESSKIDASFTIEIYKALDDGKSNAEAEEGDGKSVPHGKAKIYIGSCEASHGDFDCTLPLNSISYNNGDILTALAIDSNNNTSEFGCMKDEVNDIVISAASSPSVVEGDSGWRDMNFTISLNKPATSGISFTYKTEDLNATLADSDYEEIPPTTVTLNEGITSYTIKVRIKGDKKFENNETLKLVLYNLQNASFSNSQSSLEIIGTIINDDSNGKPFTCDDTMYMSSNSVEEPDKIKLYSIDTQTHPFNFIQIGNAYEDTYNALGYNPKDNFLYALFENHLLKIDSEGEVVDLGAVLGLPSYQLYSGTFDHNGYYYVAGKYDDSDPNIYKIDIDQMKVIDTITMKENIIVYDFAFDKEEKYLLTVNDSDKRFTKISITDGNVTKIGPVHTNFTCGAAYRDVDGRFFVSDSAQGKFYEFDTNTGEKFYLSKSKIAHLNDGANCPNAHLVFNDYGDAPLSYGSAKSYITQNVKLGNKIDHDSEPLYSNNALGDDERDEADEDGVRIDGENPSGKVLYRNGIYNLQASVTGGGYLSVWADLNRDGDFEDSNEKIISDKNITSKSIDINFTIPNDAALGVTYLRARFSTQQNLSPSQTAIDGESEDYKIIIDKKDYNISIEDVNVTEGNDGEDKEVSLRVSLSNEPPINSRGVKVDYFTKDGTAKAGIDYDSKSGVLIFAMGENEKNITITIHGDNIPEVNKDFFVKLKNARTVHSSSIPINISKREGKVTIINDDHSSFDVIDTDIAPSSYQSGKGLKTKIASKEFGLKIVNIVGDSVGDFYEANSLVPSIPFLLFLKEGNETSLLKDSNGNPLIAVITPGSSFATVSGIKIDKAIKSAKIRLKYIDLYSIFNQINDPCIIHNINHGNLNLLPQCMDNPNKYKKAFGERAFDRCILNHGAPCRVGADHGSNNDANGNQHRHRYRHRYGCYECTADALGNIIDSSDTFAIRPERFEIDFNSSKVAAGEIFKIDFKALKYNSNSTVPNYNEVNGTSFKVEYNETKSGCYEGNMSFLSSLGFNDGNMSVNAKYSEIGKVMFKIEEINGNEFAKTDADDTNDSLRLIEGVSKNLSFLPKEFDIDWDLSQEGRGFSYYSNDLTHMGAKVNLNITAKSKTGGVVRNYKGGCYAKDVSLRVNFDIDSNSSSLHLKYLDYDVLGVLQDGGVFSPMSDLNFTINIDDSNFTNGKAVKVYKIGFERNSTSPIEPAILQINDINASDSDGVYGYKSEPNKKALFYYGRVNTVDHIEGVSPINTKIYYEIYCKDCNKSKYFIDENKTSINSVFWYQNVFHTDASCGFIQNSISKKGTTNIDINSSFVFGSEDINMTNPNAPYSDTIRLIPSGWLAPLSSSYREFSVTFFNINTHWAGEGRLGHTVDEKIEATRRNRKIEW